MAAFVLVHPAFLGGWSWKKLVPLLEEYLAQGYVGGFAEPIRGYLQRLRSL